MFLLRHGGPLLAGVTVLLIHFVCSATGYECIERCQFQRSETILVHGGDDRQCVIMMPDNPHRNQSHTFPCQIAIETNCTQHCQIQVTFDKFNIHRCPMNTTEQSGVCDLVHSCEYVILRELGTDKEGIETDIVHWFDGNLTSYIFDSHTNKVLLEFCYRSETFSARNIQLRFKAIDSFVEGAGPYAPWSVYVLIAIVFVLVCAIIVIRWAPCLRPCLDPPTPKHSPSMDL